MSYSITQVLYNFLRQNRIMADVARELDRSLATLSAELRPTNTHAKLGADELVPIFEAIRAIGWGDRLEGIITEFFLHARGDKGVNSVSETDFVPMIMQMNSTLGLVSRVAERVATSTNEKELVSTAALLRAQLLPTVVRMGTIVDMRLARLRSERFGPLRVFV